MPTVEIDPLRNAESGELNEPFATAELRIPFKVTLLEEGLLLVQELGRTQNRHRTVPRQLLEKFLALRTPGSVRDFASRFGALRAAVPWDLEGADVTRWMDTEGTQGYLSAPAENGHPHFAWIPDGDKKPHSASFDDPFFWAWKEPISWWFYYRDRFERLLAAAAALREFRSPFEALASLPRLTKIEHFLLFEGLQGCWRDKPQSIQFVEASRFLGLAAGNLVKQCGIVPRLAWSNDPRALRMEFSDRAGGGAISLLGALTVQLMGAIVGTGFAVCSHCGAVFSPSRRPASSRRSYCHQPVCKKASRLQAKIDFRKREKLKRTAKRAGNRI
jgi:hypothetical protein